MRHIRPSRGPINNRLETILPIRAPPPLLGNHGHLYRPRLADHRLSPDEKLIQ
jgi:hypothetical protein